MKKRTAMALMITMILTTALTGCGTDNSTTKAAGQLPAELIATIELPTIQEDSIPVDGELLAEVEVAEPEVPADTTIADHPVTGNNSDRDATASDTGSAAAPAGASSGTPVKKTTDNTGGTGTTAPAASASTPTAPAASTPAPTQQHTHSWVQHEATGHYETQITKDAWDEAVYDTKEKSICNVCGQDITGNTTEHSKNHALAYEGSGYHSEWERTFTGYIHHDVETTEVWVEDSPAYSECSSCGARK